MIEKIIYFPKDVKMPTKKQLILMFVWGIVSFCFFILINFPNMYRSGWPLYLLGIAPMMIAFNDREFVQTKLAYDFKSLLYALYKGNVCCMILYAVSIICLFENKEDVWLRLCAVSVFWFLSVPLSVIYNKIILSMTAICAFCAGVGSWYLLYYWKGSSIERFIVISLMMVLAIILSLILSNMQIKRHFRQSGNNNVKV